MFLNSLCPSIVIVLSIAVPFSSVWAQSPLTDNYDASQQARAAGVRERQIAYAAVRIRAAYPRNPEMWQRGYDFTAKAYDPVVAAAQFIAHERPAQVFATTTIVRGGMSPSDTSTLSIAQAQELTKRSKIWVESTPPLPSAPTQSDPKRSPETDEWRITPETIARFNKEQKENAYNRLPVGVIEDGRRAAQADAQSSNTQLNAKSTAEAFLGAALLYGLTQPSDMPGRQHQQDMDQHGFSASQYNYQGPTVMEGIQKAQDEAEDERQRALEEQQRQYEREMSKSLQ